MSYIPGLRAQTPQTIYSIYFKGFHTCNGYFQCKMKVDGNGSIKVKPDTAIILLGVTTEDMQLKSAQEQNSIKVNEIINSLVKLGVSSDNMETQSYTINPQYDFIEGKQVFRGYNVTHILKITVKDMDKIGEVIDKAVSSGANTVNDINFIVSEPSIYYQQALTAAIDDALIKAKTIARRLNVIVSQVPIRIMEESYQCNIQPQPFVLHTSADTTTPIQTGQAEITARIEAIFTYI
ncbi:MAG TPA: SIMPL domain-containing protein [Pseudobacteroides sp.]|uniref:SIMPL domain-containing protein n=1 Tax=Pseudobacteroides sp. TaxID=1968840 RepID=UPI002F941113